MTNLYKNSEVRSITLKLLIFNIIFILLFYGFIRVELNKFKKLYIHESTALAGKILKTSPSLGKDIVPIFTKGSLDEDFKLGKSLLQKYGFSETINSLYIEPFETYYNSFFTRGLILCIVVFFFMYLIIIFGYKNIFNKIQSLCVTAEKIVDGDFNVNLNENGEGDFYIINHHLNKIANKLKTSIETLTRDKLFLKNILSDISHQLKTPLSSVILFNEILLKDKDIDPNLRYDFLEKTNNQLFRMKWLIISLLKLARIEAGSIIFNKQKKPVKDTINKALLPLLIKAEAKNQTILLEGDKYIVLNQDVNWTSEALSNIIKNAIEHTEEGGKILINTLNTPLCVQIYIKDNGEGISEDILPKIFDRFYKSENSLNPNSIGIGLSLSKAIIEGQGGSITVKSKVSKGTEFCITFLKHVI